MRFAAFTLFSLPLLMACNADNAPAQGNASNETLPFSAETIATFNSPWAMSFLPDGRMLITEKAGRLLLVSDDGKTATPVSNVPAVSDNDQAGLMDIVLHPDFNANRLVYISYSEPGEKGTSGTALARARFDEKAGRASLTDLQVIWRQEPKLTGHGHYSGRIAFSPDGHLFVTSGERQAFSPSQDLNQNLGKVIRLTDSGDIPADNPFYDQGRIASQTWSYGHRNLLGIAFDSNGRLWQHEMGPKGGDELNLVLKGRNYGYPTVSNGNHYNGMPIPDHSTRPEFEAPKATWTPVISPAGLIIYDGDMFPQWKGSAFIGGLSSKSLVRVSFSGEAAQEAERFDMKQRIREVEQGPDGAIWLLEDGPDAKLLKLTANSKNARSE